MKKGKFIICDSLRNLIKGANLNTFKLTISGINVDALEQKISQFKKSFDKGITVRLLSYDNGITEIKVIGAVEHEQVEKKHKLMPGRLSKDFRNQ
jgi:hypothetical protein